MNDKCIYFYMNTILRKIQKFKENNSIGYISEELTDPSKKRASTGNFTAYIYLAF